MAEFGQALLLVLTLAWISQEVPKPTPPAAEITIVLDSLRVEAASADSLIWGVR